MKVKSADVSFHLHATEDRDKVGRALMDSLGVEIMESSTLYGHNGNVILDNRCFLSQQEAEALLKKVLDGMDSADRARLREELGRHIDERGTFFIRLDKQEMMRGRLALGESDPVRVSFSLDAKGEGAEELARECLT
jgi:hypothetical protein